MTSGENTDSMPPSDIPVQKKPLDLKKMSPHPLSIASRCDSINPATQTNPVFFTYPADHQHPSTWPNHLAHWQWPHQKNRT